jgi:predicted dehydrogenase
MSHLLPNLPTDGSVQLRGVVTATGTSSRSVAKRYGFAFCGADTAAVIDDTQTAAVFIATRHDSHARYLLDSLRAGKHVFVEKPLALNMDQLEAISTAVRTAPGQVMVGFNRRFSPLVREVQRRFGTGPMSIIYRINAGAIAKDSWIQDRELGGGRIVGEACHFIDTMVFLTGRATGACTRVRHERPRDSLSDTVTINLQFANGSVGSVCYFANGPKRMRKEHIEVFKDGQCAVIEDFRELTFPHGSGVQKRSKLFQPGQGSAGRWSVSSSRAVRRGGGESDPLRRNRGGDGRKPRCVSWNHCGNAVRLHWASDLRLKCLPARLILI